MIWANQMLKDILEINRDNKNNKLNLLIAEEFYTQFITGQFLSIAEVANKCFTSNSVITNFCKALGFSGFKEFTYKLKSEYKKLENIGNIKKDKSNIEDINFNNLVSNQNEYITNISQDFLKLLNKNKKIIILSLDESNSLAIELFKLLKLKEYKVEILQDSYLQVASSFKQDQDCLFIFFILGFNYSSLTTTYNLLKNKTNNLFIISTINKAKMFNDNHLKLILNLNIDSSNFYLRYMFFYMFLVQLDNLI